MLGFRTPRSRGCRRSRKRGPDLGFLGGFWGFDGPASAQITRDLLGWQPTRPGLITDLKQGHYFT
jgi:hypothetical protein